MSNIKKKEVRQILSEDEKRGLEQVVKDHEAVTSKDGVNIGDGVQAGGSQERTVKGSPEQVQRAKKVLAEGDKDSISVYEKSRAEKRVDELTEWLSKHMADSKYVRAVPGSKEYNDPQVGRAVSHLAKVEMSPEFVNLSIERANLLRQLGREDETDLELIRP